MPAGGSCREQRPSCCDQRPAGAHEMPVADIDQPGIGRYPMPGLPMDFGAMPRQPTLPAPRLGEHTDAVLSDVLGLSAAEIARLHDAAIIAGPDGS